MLCQLEKIIGVTTIFRAIFKCWISAGWVVLNQCSLEKSDWLTNWPVNEPEIQILYVDKPSIADKTKKDTLYFKGYVRSQYTKTILNKIAKPFNKTFSGFKLLLKRFRICLVGNSRLKGIESTHWVAKPIQLTLAELAKLPSRWILCPLI